LVPHVISTQRPIEENLGARGKLFWKLHFFLGRETPAFVLRFLIEVTEREKRQEMERETERQGRGKRERWRNT
jgi:hypothetical protein